VLIPVLLLTAALDHIGMFSRRHAAMLIYSGHGGSRIIQAVLPRLTVSVGLGNALFLQNIVVPTFGSDGALWSLANEFWYYLLFPLGALALQRSNRIVMRVLYGVGFFALAAFVGKGIVELFPIWLMGTTVALFPPTKKINTMFTPWAWVIAYIPIFFFLSRYTGLKGVFSDLSLGLVTAATLWAILSCGSQPAREGATSEATRLLSRFSYSLYLIHIPLLALAASLFLGQSRWTPDAAHTLIGLAIVLIVVACAYGLATITEFRTEAIRNAVKQTLPFQRIC
jgi:peptidoglycan/LPS O-acetylase OafA/YrhL